MPYVFLVSASFLCLEICRKRVLELLEKLQESLELTDSLQESIAKRHAVFEACLTGLQSIISPRQTVQFLLWVRKFGHLLPQV
jgi:pheromone shutdown protein TraB